MTTFFLDTGYVLALEMAKDQNHARALKHWRAIAGSGFRLVTTSLVFHEITTFFQSRGRHDKAVEVGHRLLQSPSVELVHVDENLFAAGWKYFQLHDDKDYSFTDCVSFVLMPSRGLNEALAFDKHFTQAGFRKLP